MSDRVISPKQVKLYMKQRYTGDTQSQASARSGISERMDDALTTPSSPGRKKHITGERAKTESALVRADPVLQLAVPASRWLRRSVVGCPQHGDEDLDIQDLTIVLIDDSCRMTGIVHKQLHPATVVLVHDQGLFAQPLSIVVTEPTILISLRVLLPVLLPEQELRDTLRLSSRWTTD